LLDRGTIVAGYRIEGVLGQGGMSVVYRATQISLNRVVALKLLYEELSQDPGFRRRFQREGQVQAALDSLHTVTVYEAGPSAHGLFLAMRLIEGPTLKQLIQGGDLTPRRSVRLLSQVAKALEEAHAAELIHRDVKPQNVLVGTGDHAYLADFGLIKAPSDDPLTQTGQFIGTIDYVAPEMVQGELATPASDTYALAGVLFECLTGQVPFAHPNDAATLFAHVTAPPPRVTEARPDLPAALDEVIALGMAKNPGLRPSATELMRSAARAFASRPFELFAPTQYSMRAPEECSQTTRVSQVPKAPSPPASPAAAQARASST
jgi:serine/threonine protein kinase